jgi:arginyl-tRNA synthetase
VRLLSKGSLCSPWNISLIHSRFLSFLQPNGFINITLSAGTLTSAIAGIIQDGVRPPVLPAQRVLVDFSSPNIAKEMHVGHLRSTIIGDCVCRLLEFCRFDVQRVNHVGDWGTQFGMLITYLQEAFPDILTNPPNISDLTLIYKASKKRFDEDPAFKELSRLNVVRLQSGDAACRAIWQLLCQISRLEFQRVYDALDVHLIEVGESFYNPLIPATLQEMQGRHIPNTRGGEAATRSMVEDEEGMLLVKLDHFTIPLILRKSDGGYGYDSTDMAALKYRTATLKRDWLVYITDAGQAPHFHMCFDAARACGWLDNTRADHIGFGVVCGDDGKRFKTR